MDANVNPVNADVIQVRLSELLGKFDDHPEMFKGRRNWSLQDIFRILKVIAKPGEAHLLTAVVM